MNPGTTAPPQASSSQFSPSASPLHPPSVMHNAQVLSSLSTLSACFSGAVAGILGLTNTSGFILYLLTSLFTALIIALTKCQLGNIGKFVPQSHSGIQGAAGGGGGGGGNVSLVKGWWALMGLGQENLLGFLLFWIGAYALIHVYD